MRTRLPSISALLAFEAAARHLSVTRASIELNLTQTAISHQIKNLEVLLGAKLIERNPHGIALTPQAVIFLDSVRDALMEISRAVDRVSNDQNEKKLQVECLELFAIKRLIPLLPDFRAKHPDMVIHLKTKQAFTLKPNPDFDVAIWHGEGNWPDVDAVVVEPEEIFPVCSPKLFDRKPEIHSYSDLKRHTAIKYSSGVMRDEWPFWLDGVGERSLRFSDELECDNLVTSLQATLDGLGVMLGRSSIVGSDLAAGRLVEPLGARVKSPSSYYLITSKQIVAQAKVSIFKDWFLNAIQTNK